MTITLKLRHISMQLRAVMFLSVFIMSLTVAAQAHPGRQDIAPSGTLPIVHINTVNNTVIDQKETYIEASLWIDASMSTELESLGSEQSPVTLGIRGRGNTSWNVYDKKPYKIKFDKKQSVLGMPKSKHWALLNLPGDATNTATAVGYKIGELLMTEWNPRFRMVEVILNGYNIGLYKLCETVRVEETRVNIFEQEDLNEDPTVVHGGWIMEIDNYYDDEPYQIRVPSHGPRSNPYVHLTPKSPEVLSLVQTEWITAELTAIDKAINAPDVTSTEWEEYIDLESLARYIMVQEIISNCDAFRGSTYLFKDLEGKWRFGPIWDLDWTFSSPDGKGWTWEIRRGVIDPASGNALVWLPELLRFPRLQEEMRKHIATAAAHLDEILAYGESFHASIRQANIVDSQIWPQYHGVGFDTTWSHYLKPRLEKRMNWLQSPGLFDSLNSGLGDVIIGDVAPVDIRYYSPWGMRLMQPIPGELCIEVSIMSDGTVRTAKRLYRHSETEH